MIPLTVSDVIVDDRRKRFGFRRKALIGSLFYLEQQPTAEVDSGLFAGGLERPPDILLRRNSDAGVIDACPAKNCELAVLKIASAFHP
jgi:hypothetical protein